jgi:tripeptide aminopeptidase
MRAYERLLNYVKINTESDPEGVKNPSTACQFDLARILVEELKELGVKDAGLTENCLVYGHLEATKGYENADKIGFIAHLDTAPDFTGAGVNPQIHENYDGGDLALGGSGRVLSRAQFPHLSSLAGRTLITTDGTTLLGADDKAGIAEIMTMLEILKEKDLPHGKICICFTPDEEVGMGTDSFDLEAFGADYAYTVDGGPEGEVVYENFNAASAKILFEGVNVHPGSALGVMINAALLATEFAARMPKNETPATTSGYEGFYHLGSMTGSVEKAELDYIIRDHSKEKFEERKDFVRALVSKMNGELGKEMIKVEIKDSYYNMEEVVRPRFYIVERAMAATKKAGVTPSNEPIRGGTDGARLSFMGLPTPNLGTGGYAYHGPFEHITAEGMDKATEILLNIVAENAF